eukprot:Awhi_evm1s12040
MRCQDTYQSGVYIEKFGLKDDDEKTVQECIDRCIAYPLCYVIDYNRYGSYCHLSGKGNLGTAEPYGDYTLYELTDVVEYIAYEAETAGDNNPPETASSAVVNEAKAIIETAVADETTKIGIVISIRLFLMYTVIKKANTGNTYYHLLMLIIIL